MPVGARGASRKLSNRDIVIPLIVIALAGIVTWGWIWISSDEKPADGPRVTVGKYMAAMRSKNVRAAQDLLCSGLAKDKQDIADRIQRFRSLNYEIGESTKKSDDEYVVKVEVDALVNVDGQDTQSTTIYVFEMLKEKKRWRVCGITG